LPYPEAEEDPEDDTNYDKKLPRSDFGDYCPVSFVRDGFLIKGNPEVESTLLGRTFLFAGEPE
jgi:YHS domain-containing protein